MLQTAKRPLVLVGQGMAWSGAENEVRDFIDRTQIPVRALAEGQGRDARTIILCRLRRPARWRCSRPTSSS